MSIEATFLCRHANPRPIPSAVVVRYARDGKRLIVVTGRGLDNLIGEVDPARGRDEDDLLKSVSGETPSVTKVHERTRTATWHGKLTRAEPS